MNYQTIEQAVHVDAAISPEMQHAMDLWAQMYLDKSPWLASDTMTSLNIPARVANELARQITLELDVTFSDPGQESDDDGAPQNELTEYLTVQFDGVLRVLNSKLELGLAAGGMIIKPCPDPKTKTMYFSFVPTWSLMPIAFDGAGNLTDVIIPDYYVEGKNYYTRLERHTLKDGLLTIENKAYKSNSQTILGQEVSLESVPCWANILPEFKRPSDKMLFGYFKTACANNVDPFSPLGASVYSKAVSIIKQIDEQYSRLIWEFEGSELAVDIDDSALLPDPNNPDRMVMAKNSNRLFRRLRLEAGDKDFYEVFSPAIRDVSQVNGLNVQLMRCEDNCGLSRGTLSDANAEARTATELKIMKQRSYATVADNQKNLEHCLRDVISAMVFYALDPQMSMAPAGEYEVSFDWDDSILTDADAKEQLMERMFHAGCISDVELRMYVLGETRKQAQAAIDSIQEAKSKDIDNMLKMRDE